MERYMKRLTLITLLLAIVLPFVPADAKKKKTASISFAVKEYNFGSINEDGGPVSHIFEFENKGDGNLVIADAESQCGCTVPEYPQNPVAPGKKGKIKVTYNPLARPGGFFKTVTIFTNGSPRKVNLKIKGQVIPKSGK